jgi:hypothetical protein
MGKPSRIIVIGAGVSGLACARELRQRGYEVLVIEARSRVGGRLKGEYLELGAEYPSSLPIITNQERGRKKKQQQEQRGSKHHGAGGRENTDGETDSNAIPTTTQHPVDVGGALIHGIKNNPIHQITSQMGVPIHDISDYCLLMDANGWPFDPKVDEKMSTLFNDCLDATFALAEEQRDSKESFGSFFDRVYREKSRGIGAGGGGTVTTGTSGTNSGGGGVDMNPLLKWHRANLELPSGASFYNLGMTWNEDEPYGFDGAHAAVEPSWKLVMERLADDLVILRDSPVTEIRIVLPDGTTPDHVVAGKIHPTKDDRNNFTHDTKVEEKEKTVVIDEIREDRSEQTVSDILGTEANSMDMHIGQGPIITPISVSYPSDDTPLYIRRSTLVRPPFFSNVKSTGKKRTRQVAPEASRFSRRLRGDDINVRRSARSTKGTIQLLQIGSKNSLSYDHPNKKRLRRKKEKQAKANIEKTLSTEGESTQIDQAPVQEELAESSSKVQVTLENGSVLEADAVVCTLPLGILKVPKTQHGHVSFVPPLPESKQKAIEELGCGLLNKCVMSFPNAFWQDSEFLGLAGSEHSYLVLNAMKYTQKPILIFMYGGAFAKEVETWTDSEIVDDCLDVLKRICGTEVPLPVDYCITRWGHELYSRMAFTYIPPGVDGPRDLTAMSQAVYDPSLPGKPLLMFAGEHTTPYHPSTMHGAFLSGIREAYRYDLFMEPALNDHIQFTDNDQIYQHTFPTKKVYKNIRGPHGGSKNGMNKLPSNGTPENVARKLQEKRSRSRGFGGMSLRKRPKTLADTSPSPMVTISQRLPTATYIPDSATRRSQRTTSSGKMTSSPGLPYENDEARSETIAVLSKLNKSRTDQLEDRCLARAYESYGNNYTLVRSKVVPVHGSSRRRSVNQIHHRWQVLRGGTLLQEATSWETWEAERPLLVSTEKQFGDSFSSSTTNGSSLRRSRRDAKPRDNIFNL